MTLPGPGPDEQSITLVRVIAAPVAEVFRAWTDPALIRQWLVPVFCRIVEADVDARPGGRYRIVTRGPFGGRHITTGEYREIVPNRRLVQSWVFEGSGTVADRYPTLLTVDFRELGPHSTELTLRQDLLLTKRDRSGNLTGWKMCLGKLEKVLRREAAGVSRAG